MNPFADDTSTTDVFLPPLGLLVRNVTLWTDYFFRFSPFPPSPAGNSMYPSTSLRAGANFDCELYPIVTQEDAWEGVWKSNVALRVDDDTPRTDSQQTSESILSTAGQLQEDDREGAPPPLKAKEEGGDFLI